MHLAIYTLPAARTDGETDGCEQMGKSPILLQETCENALHFVKASGYSDLNYGKVRVTESKLTPRGCYVYYYENGKGKGVWFNTHATGAKPGKAPYCLQVCEEYGKLTRRWALRLSNLCSPNTYIT